jgi:nicotinamide-nucleotide amidase
MIPDALFAEAEALLAVCRARRILLATAESCTGGLIAATLTAIAGASDVVDRGFVTYSNEAKHELVGVPLGLIQTEGAVSEAVARAMAEGALARSRATIAILVTGVAGPGGGWCGSAWQERASRRSVNNGCCLATAPASGWQPWDTRLR